jgi:iron complex outermembrane receptor protein
MEFLLINCYKRVNSTIKLFSAAVNRFTFKDFIDGDNNYSGNKLTGVPNAQWNVGLDASSTSGFSLTTSFLVK